MTQVKEKGRLKRGSFYRCRISGKETICKYLGAGEDNRPVGMNIYTDNTVYMRSVGKEINADYIRDRVQDIGILKSMSLHVEAMHRIESLTRIREAMVLYGAKGLLEVV